MNLWFSELHTKGSGLVLKVKKYLYSGNSPYQKIDIFESEDYGKVLVLDGLVMTTERDEFIYHEMLTHPAMRIHPNPQNILIIGGGDGGTAREALRYSEVKRAVLVEIDEMVVELSKKYLGEISSAYNDPRLEVVIQDGIEFVKNCNERFDIIFLDTSDPVGPAEALYRKDFYQSLKKCLKKNGIISAQTESPWVQKETVKKLYREIKDIFNDKIIYFAHIPTYPGGIWSFMLLGEKIELYDIKRPIPGKTKYYNDEIHRSMTALPEYFKHEIAE